ncbi:MAG: cell division protein FtsZ [Hyphomonadaceae bacterium]|nr:cell division protein FtsZ [Hyphomonadaceae bacterium]
MSLNLSLPKSVELKPRIIVMGVGGAGGNAVNNMIGAGLNGVEFVVANTDAQALAFSKADRSIQMGSSITQGLGAGMKPEVGEQSAEDSMTEILEHLEGAHMLFIAAGMGGGTGTGAAPVIARAARERGILTVAIVTKPFDFEGSRRMAIAETGINTLFNAVDTLITIPNQNLFRVANEQTTMSEAFSLADEVLHSGVRSVTDLMVVPGLINLDFADVKTIMDEMGKAMMGTGEAKGERRAIDAAESAIKNPLLDDVSLRGASGVLINITGGKDLTLYEVDEAASLIRGQVDQEANIIVGSSLDGDLDGIVRVSVVATGVEAVASSAYVPDRASPAIDLQHRVASAFEAPGRTETGVEAPPVSGPEPCKEPTYMDELESDPRFTPSFPPAPEVEIRTPGTQERIQTKHQSKTDPEPRTQTVVKRPFGFFGRKKVIPVSTAPSRARVQDTGDLFGKDIDEEIEIPSFLRRSGK